MRALCDSRWNEERKNGGDQVLDDRFIDESEKSRPNKCCPLSISTKIVLFALDRLSSAGAAYVNGVKIIWIFFLYRSIGNKTVIDKLIKIEYNRSP